LVFSSSISPPRHLFGVPAVDLRAGGTRGAECQPAELQLRGRRLRAFLDEFHREGSGLLVLVLLHHFEAVHDGADRADEVVADPRAEQGGEVERFKHKRAGHWASGCERFNLLRLGDSGVEGEPPL
jgi:hypothetical protein